MSAPPKVGITGYNQPWYDAYDAVLQASSTRFTTACTSGTSTHHHNQPSLIPPSGNAFALFLKSQRKWDNPALQDDHRDQFRNLCIEHKYDGAK